MIDEQLGNEFDPVFLDSILHLDTAALDKKMRRAMPKPGLQAVLLYGDCSAHALDMGAGEGRARTRGSNCCEIMLGPERFRELRKAGAFSLMPEWTDRLEEIFKSRLGFKDSELAQSLMADTITKIVYLDTGSRVPPLETLTTISNYLGLPFEIEETGIKHLEDSLRMALLEVHHG